MLEKGEVFTFRTKKRKRVGNDWMNDGRGKRKIADVFIEEIERIEMGFPFALRLDLYVDKSGFRDVHEWLNEIRELNGDIPCDGWIYKVRLR